MDTLLENIVKEQNDKIIKPDTTTRAGRSLLAFYLKTKFKQIINYDKKHPSRLVIDYKDNFLDRFTQRLIDRPHDRILVAISGESASGKSTICDKIRHAVSFLNLPVTIMSADNYFHDISDLIKKYGNFDALRDAGFDIDSPNNFYLNLLKDDLYKLQKGSDVMAPEYLVNGSGISKPKSLPVKSSKIVLVEGMCSIYKDVSDIFDIKIYVELDELTRKERFMKRAQSRNQDPQNALKHWEYIKEAGKKYVISNRDKCDFILNGNCDLVYVEYILQYIHLITNNFTNN